MKRKAKQFLVLLLCIAMGFNSVSLDAFALNPVQIETSVLDEADEAVETNADDVETIDEDKEDVSEDDTEDVSDDDAEDVSDDDSDLVEGDVSDDDILDEDVSSDDVSDNDVSENDVSENESTDVENDFYFRDLTEAELDKKEFLAGDFKSILGLVEDVDYVADEVYCVVEREEEAEEIAKAYSEATGMDVTVSSFNDGVVVFALSGETTIEEYSSVNRVACVVGVASDSDNNLPALVPNYIQRIMSIGSEVNTTNEGFTDPFTKSTSNYYQWYHEKVNDKFVWKSVDNLETKLSNITVAVVDSGINYNHTDLKDNIKQSVNFVVNDYDASGNSKKVASGSDEAKGFDTNGHGTNVAGIIANLANSIGGRGVAAGVKIDSVRVLNRKGNGSSSDIVSGLKWIADNASKDNIKVVNMSIGGYFKDPYYYDAIQAINNKGVLIVAAAGNENSPAFSYPASYDGVMSVAALNSDLQRSSFSNYGSKVDIAAPGGTFKPANNDNGYTAELLWASGYSLISSNTIYTAVDGGQPYQAMAGTSQATPVVSGCAAIVFAVGSSSLRGSTVAMLLQETATPIKTDKPCGAGCVNVAAALGISTTVAAPTTSISGTVIPMTTKFTFTFPSGKVYEDAVVYYTTNGKVPTPDNMAATDTKIATGQVTLSGTGKVTVKAITVLYGKKSSVATFNYTFDDKAVTAINLTSKTGFNTVAIGKKLSLVANITPSTAKDKKVIWSSNDSTIAKVDASGNVTGLSAGETTIKATSASDKSKVASFTVKVTVPATKVTYAGGTTAVNLANGKTYNLASQIAVEPSGQASSNCTYTSSNAKVLTVNANGLVTAVGSGKANVTVTAADGTGVKTSVSFVVTTALTQISISSASGYNGIAVGKKLKFTTSFNSGKTTPDNKNLKWTVSSNYPDSIKINEKTGELSVDSKLTITSSSVTAKVWAVGENNIKSNELVIKIFAVSTGYQNDGRTKYCDKMDGGNLKSYLYSKNRYTCTDFTFTTSNPKIVEIDESGSFTAISQGTATLTLAPKDGSGKKASLKIYVYGDDIEAIGIETKNGINVIYPGKSLSYNIIASQNIPSKYFELVFNNGASDSYVYRRDNYLTVNGFTLSGGKYLNRVTPGKVCYVYMIWKNDTSDLYAANTVELYPVGTSAVNLNKTSMTLQSGECQKITASSSPEKACQKYYTYKSSNPKVAKVAEDGSVVGISNGTATITVTAGDGSGKTAKCTVTVANNVKSILMGTKNGVNYVGVGKTLQINATVNADAANKKLTWSVSDSSIAKVDASGKITGLKVGSVKVTAKAQDRGGVAGTYTVQVLPVTTGFETNNSDVNAGKALVKSVGSSTNVTVSAIPKASLINYAVSSSNTKVATVTGPSSAGVITIKAVSSGSANIVVSALDGSGKTMTIKLTVTKPVSSLTITAKGYQHALPVGKALQLTATTNADATNKKVDWTVSDSSIATVSASGQVKALKKGSVTVTAKATDGSGMNAQYKVTVVEKAVGKVEIKKGDVLATNITLSSLAKGSLINTCDFSVALTDAQGGKDCTSDWLISVAGKASISAQKIDANTIRITAGKTVGTATVTITAADGSGKSAKINVTVVNPVTKITLTNATGIAKVSQGKTMQILANVNEDASNKKLTWSLDCDSTVATISPSGQLKVNAGTKGKTITVTVKATDGSNVSATYKLTVIE